MSTLLLPAGSPSPAPAPSPAPICDFCGSTDPGARLVLDSFGAPYYSLPCSAGSAMPAGTLPQCTQFTATGSRATSTCGDGQCYLQVCGGQSWLILYA